MDAAELVRAARQLTGTSQRALARRAGVAASTVAAIESAQSAPSFAVVARLARAGGFEISLAAPSRGDDDDLRRYLSMSSSERLYLSLGGEHNPLADRWCRPWLDLRRLASTHTVVLEPAAAIGVWLPDVRVPTPLPVRATPRSGPDSLRETDVDGFDGVVVTGDGGGDVTGLVPVGVGPLLEVWVPSPWCPSLAVDPETGAAMRRAAWLLDAEHTRDAADRRTPAHRNSNVEGEHDRVMTLRRYGDRARETPDARYRRDWRLGGESSFRQWLVQRRYPV